MGFTKRRDFTRLQEIQRGVASTADQRRGQLTEPGIEAQRQHAQDDVIGPQAQIVSDAIGARHQVTLRQHHAFGPSRRAGGVQNGRRITVCDGGVCVEKRRIGQCVQGLGL